MSSSVEGHNRSMNIRKYQLFSNGSSFFDLTLEQQKSIHKVMEHQGVENLKAVYPPGNINPYVGLQFTHIFIGIEPDGYTHS